MRVVADFLRTAVSVLEQPDEYSRTIYLQVEIDIALLKAVEISRAVKVARAMRRHDEVIKLNGDLHALAHQLSQMAFCVEAEFAKAYDLVTA